MRSSSGPVHQYADSGGGSVGGPRPRFKRSVGGGAELLSNSVFTHYTLLSARNHGPVLFNIQKVAFNFSTT